MMQASSLLRSTDPGQKSWSLERSRAPSEKCLCMLFRSTTPAHGEWMLMAFGTVIDPPYLACVATELEHEHNMWTEVASGDHRHEWATGDEARRGCGTEE